MSPLPSISIKTIVVATDLSLSADTAVEQAAWLAKRFGGANLWILHVFDDSFLASVKGVYDAARWSGNEPVLSARNHLSQQVRDIADRYGISVTGETRTGHPATEIAHFMNECGTDLVVVGKHGENSGGTFIGGTALKVLKRSNVPVLLTHRNTANDYSKVLVATDFSDCSHKAARYAFGLFPGALHYVLHTYYIAFEGFSRMAGASDRAIESYRDNELQSADEKMAQMRATLAVDKSLQVEWKNVQGYPGREVIKQSENLGIDLIVIGKRGFVNLGDHLLGSVTQNVLYHTDKNVLLVPDNLDEDKIS
ncbi:MAG: universal stress protein [Azonexus sp.]|nr:universal stress protein [Azonexus sp.]